VLNATYHSLAASAFTQDWSNTALIAADNDWSAVPSILGFHGDGLAPTPGTSPQTILAAGPSVPPSVLANQAAPDALGAFGVAEFHLLDPTVALRGGPGAAPHLLLHLDTTGTTGPVAVSFTVRDIDGSPRDATVAVALQYRLGEVGDFTDVPAAFTSDATDAGVSNRLSRVSALLPPAAWNHPQLQVRIVTADAFGEDEWVGVDDIRVEQGAVVSGRVYLDANDNGA
jgi:hypothetical protein